MVDTAVHVMPNWPMVQPAQSAPPAALEPVTMKLSGELSMMMGEENREVEMAVLQRTTQHEQQKWMSL